MFPLIRSGAFCVNKASNWNGGTVGAFLTTRSLRARRPTLWVFISILPRMRSCWPSTKNQPFKPWNGPKVGSDCDGVSTEHQVVWRIVFVHDTFHENHARMRRIQHLFQLATGVYNVGFCFLVTAENI